MPANFGPSSGSGEGSGSGGGGALIVATRTDNSNPAVFADFAALETYTATPDGTTDAANINVSSSTSATTVFAVGTLNTGNQVTSITAAYIRLNGTWEAVATNLVGTPGADGGGVTFSGLDPYEVVMIGPNSEPIHSGIRRTNSGTGPYEFDETSVFPQESIQIGYSGILSAFGAVPQIRSYISGRRLIQPFTYWSKAAGTERTREITLEPSERVDAQTDTSTTIPLSGTFSMQATASEALTDLYFTLAPGTSVTALRFRARIEGMTEPFYYYPTRADYEEGTGADFADTGNDPNTIRLDIISAPLVVFEAQTLEIDYEIDSGSILGDASNNPAVSVDRNVISLTDLAYVSEIPAPVPQTPSISQFRIQGQATSVDAGTTLTGNKTFQYGVVNADQVGTGSITQSAGGTTGTLSASVDPTQTSIDLPVTDATLAAGESSVFTLTFPITSGGNLTISFTVRARTPAETLYYGTIDTNIPASVDVSTLTMQDVFAGTTFDANFDLDNTHYAVILSPADRELNMITERTFSAPILTDFTKVDNVRTIGGQQYDSYVHQNNSGATATLATTISVS